MKICQVCKTEFVKKPKETYSDWNKKRFCSYNCYWSQKKQPNWLNHGGGFHKGHKHSLESRKVMSAKAFGISIKDWLGFADRTENKKIRGSTEYIQWRKNVLKRDYWTCQECKIKKRNVQADHIKSFALFPELRFELSNGRTLCEDCHKKTETWGRNIKRQLVINTGF